ncbi:MAG: HAD family phosphatase [Sediminibacterium sp.]|nr:HAD family phosphatase [Sediminibacterium sp.]
MTNIKHIIFDLGGIFLNLDYQRTAVAFQQLGVANFNELFTQHHANPLFSQLETGEVSDTDFYHQIRTITQLPLSDTQIAEAWNAMLLDMPAERITWLQQVAQQHSIYLFSNTNTIHYQQIQLICERDLGDIHFNSLFQFAGYSHFLGFRKPHVNAFRAYLQQLQLPPETTLFIDDTPGNIQGASEAGLHTLLLSPPREVLELDRQHWENNQGFTSSKSI